MFKKPKKIVDDNKGVDDDINYKKLFFEIMVILTVIFGISVAFVGPYIHDKIKDRDRYEQYRDIITRVDEYDYSKGRDLELEKELDKAVKDSRNDTESHFYILASGIYYCNVRMYKLAYDAFEWLSYYGLEDTEERLDVEARDVLCQRKQESEGKYVL